MGEFRYIHPDEMAKRHRAAENRAPSRQISPTRSAAQRQPVQRNVDAVLSLGDIRYFTYHGRVYCVPTVPFKLGEKVLDAYTRATDHAKEVALTGDRKISEVYFEELYYLTGLLWTHIRPIGKVKRALWRLGLIPNPFRRGSEGDVREVTDFFLQGRMKSSVRSISEMEARK